jgi:flagellar motor protein MotB
MDDGKTVLIEQGPKAVLAAVVRGLPSPSLRVTLQEALDSIHVELNEALQNFRGDKKAFEAARPHLESCLLHEEKSNSSNETSSTRGGLSPARAVVLMLLLTALVWGITWGVTSYLERQRWADFLGKASETPGIHITSITANGKNGKTTVYGLRDPLSDNPQEIAREVGLLHETIDFQLESYLSLQPELIARRAKVILNPPESVRLSVPNGTTVLNIAGAAPHAWIAQIPKIGSMIPGVTSIHDAELQDESRLRLDQLVREIEAHQIEFEAGSAAESELDLRKLRQALRESDTLAQQLGSRMRVEIHGHTSEEGSAEANRRLALARAQQVVSALRGERFLVTDFLPIADSLEASAMADIQGSKLLRARRVSFHVIVNDSGSAGARP